MTSLQIDFLLFWLVLSVGVSTFQHEFGLSRYDMAIIWPFLRTNQNVIACSPHGDKIVSFKCAVHSQNFVLDPEKPARFHFFGLLSFTLAVFSLQL